jgi:DNA-binding MarR family transcriptional regulator
MQKRSEQFAKLLQHSSDVSTTLLPLGGSLIAYKLLLNLYLSQLRGETLTVKALFASIPYSDMGIRYHSRKLLNDGWIDLLPSPSDKRTKICVPTDKFDKAWALVVEQVSEQFDQYIANNRDQAFDCQCSTEEV